MKFLFENLISTGTIHIEQDSQLACGYNMEALEIPVPGYLYSCCNVCFKTWLTPKTILEPLNMVDDRLTCPFCHLRDGSSVHAINRDEEYWECDLCGKRWVESLAPVGYRYLTLYDYRVVKKLLGWVTIGVLPKYQIRGAWGNALDAWKYCERDYDYKLTHPRSEWL